MRMRAVPTRVACDIRNMEGGGVQITPFGAVGAKERIPPRAYS